jgi:hypothetical protein
MIAGETPVTTAPDAPSEREACERISADIEAAADWEAARARGRYVRIS